MASLHSVPRICALKLSRRTFSPVLFRSLLLKVPLKLRMSCKIMHGIYFVDSLAKYGRQNSSDVIFKLRNDLYRLKNPEASGSSEKLYHSMLCDARNWADKLNNLDPRCPTPSCIAWSLIAIPSRLFVYLCHFNRSNVE